MRFALLEYNRVQKNAGLSNSQHFDLSIESNLISNQSQIKMKIDKPPPWKDNLVETYKNMRGQINQSKLGQL